VIHVYEVGVAEARVFLAMEFVRGQSLRGWSQVDRSWAEVVGIFVQAGRGLAAAHAAGVVHCDFKPDNVLVGVDGRVRVLDFGLARRGDP
jgi:serine/threonine protein kinase